MQIFDPDGVTEALDTGQGGGRGHHTIEVIGKTRESKIVDRTRILSSGGINNCLRSTDYKDPTKVAIPVLTPDRAEKRQNGRRFKEDGEESFTLTAQDRHGVAVEVTGYNATLKRGGRDGHGTSVMCERLQRSEQSDDDRRSDMFAIDKGIRPEEREIANCIESREDRGLSKRKQEGTLICHKIT